MDGWMDGWINKNPETAKYPGHYLRPFNIVYMSVRLQHALGRGGYYFESILLKNSKGVSTGRVLALKSFLLRGS